MTWYFDPSGETFDLYDHTGSKVRSNVQMADPSWQDFDAGIDPGAPPELRQEMRDIWEQEANLGNSPVMSVYAGKTLMHMMDGPIEEGTP